MTDEIERIAMTPPEPGAILTTLAHRGVSAASEVAEGFLTRLVGPAASELGGVLGDFARVYRLEKTVRLIGRVQEILEAGGVTPHQVPLKTILPLLDGATVEEDPLLGEMWASLLANAASEDPSTNDPHPAYVSILRSLSAVDALVLRSICARSHMRPRRLRAIGDRIGAGGWEPRPWAKPPLDDVDRVYISLGLLTSLGLVERYEDLSLDTDGEGVVTAGQRGELRTPTVSYFPTSLGIDFLQRCDPAGAERAKFGEG